MSVGGTEVLEVVDDGGVRLLRFNRPDARNAFNQELWYALTDALEDAVGNAEVRCVVLTGAGEKAFCAGQDLAEMTDPTVFEGQEPGYNRFMPVLEAFPKPVLAAVNGVAVGIGMTMLPHCDLVLMSTEARLKAPFLSLGVTTEGSASVLFPATMGWQRAIHLLYTEPWVGADEAVELGLALTVCTPDRLLDETMGLARHIAGLDPAAVQATKRLLLAGRLDAVRAARLRELAEFEHLVGAMLERGGPGSG